jgi:hypothetical protein
VPSNKRANRRRQAARSARPHPPGQQQQRLKLPQGSAVLIPDESHPAWDAIGRLRAGTGTAQDMDLVTEWLPTTDLRYWQHMMRVARAPRQVEDVLVSRGRVTPTSDAAETIKARLAATVIAGELGMCAHVRRCGQRGHRRNCAARRASTSMTGRQ